MFNPEAVLSDSSKPQIYFLTTIEQTEIRGQDILNIKHLIGQKIRYAEFLQ